MDSLIAKFSKLSLHQNKIILIQKCFRGWRVRKRHLPLILYRIRTYLKSITFNFSSQTNDGRVNSSLDEDEIIKLLVKKFNHLIKKPKSRMWYDILLYDRLYGWLPVNIKTTTMVTADNTGNLAMCVYSYTNKPLNLNSTYENGDMADILFTHLHAKKYNKNVHKDYYFIVLNKKDPTDVVINSIKGLTVLTPNINNLPFQVCWNKNREYHYDYIANKISLFIHCIQKPNPSWKETFLNNMRNIKC